MKPTPAVQGLIDSALQDSPDRVRAEYAQSYDGSYAAEIIQEAIDALESSQIDAPLKGNHARNLATLHRRLRQLKREAKR